MGSCTHFDTTLNEAIDCELGPENRIVARGAGGGDYSSAYGGWAGSVWMVVEHATQGRWLAECLWSRNGRDTTIKWVSEDMGPGNHDVPEHVWRERPPLNGDETFAVTWRRHVEEFHARYPHYVRQLGEADAGRLVMIHGHDADGPWAYLGEKRHRRTTVKVFRAPDGRVYRLPRAEEKLRRFNYA